MFGLDILEVAIGLAFVYLLLSTFSSALVEAVEMRLNMRKELLLDGISALLTDQNLRNAFGEHPLIKAMNGGSKLPDPVPDDKRLTGAKMLYRRFTEKGSPEVGPSYIPGRTFVAAILDIATRPASDTPRGDVQVQQNLDSAPHDDEEPVDHAQAHDNQIAIVEAGRDVNAAAREAGPPVKAENPNPVESKIETPAILNNPPAAPDALPADAGGAGTVSAGLSEFRRVRDALEKTDTQLNRALLALFDQAGGDMAQARKDVEQWFDDTMDRISGEFKRYAVKINFVFAVLIVVFANADSIALARHLWQDDAARKAIAIQAENYQKSAEQAKIPNVDDLGRLERIQSELESTNLPLGWDVEFANWKTRWKTEWELSWESHWILGVVVPILILFFTKAVGLGLTILAVSLGAPFWVELLNKFISLRNTGSKPLTLDDKEKQAAK